MTVTVCEQSHCLEFATLRQELDALKERTQVLEDELRAERERRRQLDARVQWNEFVGAPS